MTWNKRHKLLRRVFSTVMALVLAVSLLPTYAFAARVPTSTTTDGNAADFTGAWKSAHLYARHLYRDGEPGDARSV